ARPGGFLLLDVFCFCVFVCFFAMAAWSHPCFEWRVWDNSKKLARIVGSGRKKDALRRALLRDPARAPDDPAGAQELPPVEAVRPEQKAHPERLLARPASAITPASATRALSHFKSSNNTGRRRRQFGCSSTVPGTLTCSAMSSASSIVRTRS